MTTNIQAELDKISQVEAQVLSLHQYIEDRLPSRYQHMAAYVCMCTWLLRTKQLYSNKEQFETKKQHLLHKLRIEVGAFVYQVKEKDEMLTQRLCELDTITSFGDQELKNRRKALVRKIQELLVLTAGWKKRGSRLQTFADRAQECMEREDIHDMEDETSDQNVNEDAIEDDCEESRADVRTAEYFVPAEGKLESTCECLEENGDAMSEISNQQEDSSCDVTSQQEYSTCDATTQKEDSPCNATNQKEYSSCEASNQKEYSPCDVTNQKEDDEMNKAQQMPSDVKTMYKTSNVIDKQMEVGHTVDEPEEYTDYNATCLPVWKPYYRICPSEISFAITIHLRGVQERNYRIQLDEHTRFLHIVGIKLPTEKEYALTRFSGIPTFGRFDVSAKIPKEYNLELATQMLRPDGVLEIRIPARDPLAHGEDFVPVIPILPYRRCLVW